MIRIKNIEKDNFSDWANLYDQYGKFYHIAMDQAHIDLVWGWIHNPNAQFHALGAFQAEQLIGFAHYRFFLHSTKAATSVFMDDLFVDPKFRSKGIGRALIEAVYAEGKKNKCKLVRWVTASDNLPGKALYDKCAKLSNWEVYEHYL